MRGFIQMSSFILFILITAGAQAAEMLTLHEAIDSALANSPDLKAFTWSVESRKSDARAAMGQYFPKVSLEERIMNTDNPTYGFMAKLNQERFTQDDFAINRLNNPDDITDIQTLLTVEQPLFMPKVLIGSGMAKKELQARQAELAIKKEEVALNVVKMFLQVQTAHGYVEAAHMSIEDAREHKRLASLKYDVGTVVYSDKLRTEVELKRAEADLSSAKANLDVSQRSLGLIMGRTEPVDITGDVTLPPLSDVNSYLAASQNRQDVEAMKIRFENTKAGVKIERSGFLPEIGIRGSYQLNDDNSPFSPEGKSYMIMGFLRWNIFDASQYSNIKKAKAEEKMVEHNLISLKNRVNYDVHNAFIRVREKELNLSLARTILQEAEEALRLVRLRYENSLASLVDLLDTQVMLNKARAGLVEAQNAYSGAMADLYFKSGTLLQTLNNNR